MPSSVRIVDTSGRIGSAAARNAGMAHALAEFIAFLDDDDVWFPTHLADALRCLDEHPEADIYASSGLVLDSKGSGRIEPAVLIAQRKVADYYFEPAVWHSRSRRILTPTIVFRASLSDHHMDVDLKVDEDTWWLLMAEKTRGARLIQSSHIGVAVQASTARSGGRWDQRFGDAWLNRIESVRPGGAAAHLVGVGGREAVRDGDPLRVLSLGRRAIQEQNGLKWLPVTAAQAAAASLVDMWTRFSRRLKFEGQPGSRDIRSLFQPRQ